MSNAFHPTIAMQNRQGELCPEVLVSLSKQQKESRLSSSEADVYIALSQPISFDVPLVLLGET